MNREVSYENMKALEENNVSLRMELERLASLNLAITLEWREELNKVRGERDRYHQALETLHGIEGLGIRAQTIINKALKSRDVPPPDPLEPYGCPSCRNEPCRCEPHECETCRGEGFFDGRIGGEWTSNPKSPCPDCGGRDA